MNPRTVKVGAGAVVATQRSFIDGYQAGHLSYMAAQASHPHLYADHEIIRLFLERLEDLSLSSPYSIGFSVGWLHTLATRGTQQTEPQATAVSSDTSTQQER